MPDPFYIISKRWKLILFVTALSVTAAAVTVFLVKPEYLSVATALPASSLNNDKTKVFGENTQVLYPSVGTAEELDRIVGTAQLDTVYIAMVRRFPLAAHYGVKDKGDAAIIKSAMLLRRDTKVIKSDYGELKVKVWSTDRAMAPQLANGIMEELDSIHRRINNQQNLKALASVAAAQGALRSELDSVQAEQEKETGTRGNTMLLQTRIMGLLKQAEQYERLTAEYKVMIDGNPSVLSIVEGARVAAWPDRPKRVQVLVATFVLAMIFSILLGIYLERRKS